jgi:hypothetical protein
VCAADYSLRAGGRPRSTDHTFVSAHRSKARLASAPVASGPAPSPTSLTAAVALRWHAARLRYEDPRRGPDPHRQGHRLRPVPVPGLAINAAWLELALAGIDLLAWTRTLLLDGELAVAEPKKLRYRLLHVAARITRSARRTRLRIPETWPWAPELIDAFARLAALPRPIT